MEREVIINIDKDWVLPAESQLTMGTVVRVIATPKVGPSWAKVRGVYVAGINYILLIDERCLVPYVFRDQNFCYISWIEYVRELISSVKRWACEFVRCLWCGKVHEVDSYSKLYIVGEGKNDIERQWDALIPEHFKGAVLCSAGCVNSLFDLLYKQETLKRLPQLEEMVFELASLKDDLIALAEKKMQTDKRQ